MVYSKVQDEAGTASGGYVISILVNGQVMSEQADGTVVVPFETEYQIRLRNKTAVRAMAKVYIDEQCVTPEGLIINFNDKVDLDRPTAKPTKFKFVAVDSFEALDEGKHHLDNPAMGVIRVEFYKEKTYTPPTHIYPYYWHSPYIKSLDLNDIYGCSPQVTRGLGEAVPTSVTFNCSNENVNVAHSTNLEAGATVSGGHSNQNFISTYFNQDYSIAPTVLRLVLKGYWANEVQAAAPQPALARYCAQCNAKRKRPSARFCEICGNKF